MFRTPRRRAPDAGPASGVPTRIFHGAIAILAIGLGVLLAGTFGLTALVDLRLSDLRFLPGERAPTGQVVLVDIDAKSLAEIGVWPWPRGLHGALVDEASRLGAAQIAFDVDFSAASSPEADAAFAHSLSGSRAATFLAAIVQEATAGGEEIVASLPVDPLLGQSWPAAVNVPVDADGKVRRFPTALDFGDERIASMPSVLANREPSEAIFGIDYAIDAASIRRISYVDVLKGNVAADALRGKTLIVGATALELRDLFPVPLFGIVSGSTIIALATETLLQGRELAYVDPPLAVLILIGLALAAACAWLRSWSAVGTLVAFGFALEGLAFYFQTTHGLVLATARIQFMLAGFGLWALLREFGLRRLLLWTARTERDNGQHMLERVIEDGFDGIIILDENDRIARINETACGLLGIGRAAEITNLPGQMIDGIAAARRAFEEGRDVARQPFQEEVAAGSDEARVLEYTIAPFRLSAILSDASPSEYATFACVTVRDVTDRERAQERMRYLALHDSLTGLNNRPALEQALEGAGTGWDPARGVALLAFDLDRFKAVNDALGHGIGDKVLIETARRVGTLFRAGDVLARIGGDEFAALFWAATEDDARHRGEELVARVAQPFNIDGHRISVGTSVGIAWSSDGVASVEAFIRQADVALYQSKQSADGCVTLFRPHMEDARLRRLELERDLMDAFENGEFALAYQPQVKLGTRELTGVEALLRWRHPTKGFISPADFIPVAEEMGLIHRLGSWVLTEACRDAANWPVPIKVAVNVSSIQFETGNLVSAVKKAIETSGLPVERLELEITESAFVMESERLKGIFDQLLELGTSFALDDFGTGYSSLGYLHRFPIAKIKIDRAFVAGIPLDGHAMAILRSIKALSEGLGIRTIAEGIETEEQAEVLRLMGCDDGQGYLFSRPVNCEAIQRLLELSSTSGGVPLSAVA